VLSRRRLIGVLGALLTIFVAIFINLATIQENLPKALTKPALVWPVLIFLAAISMILALVTPLDEKKQSEAAHARTSSANIRADDGATVHIRDSNIAGRDAHRKDIRIDARSGHIGAVAERIETVIKHADAVHLSTQAAIPIPEQLPPPPSCFVGRRTELETVRKQIITRRDTDPVEKPGAVVVTGGPGIGKSALAVYLAHQLKSEFPDGQLYLDLRNKDGDAVSPLTALEWLLDAFGIPATAIPRDASAASAKYRSELSRRRILILLENAANSDQVRPLLPGSANSAVIVTSRMPLSGLMAAAHLKLELLNEAEAVELLTTSAERKFTAAEALQAKIVAEHCGYLPLALHITGARLRSRPAWSAADMAQKLADERRRLDELQLEDVAVRASFAISYQELAPEERRTLRLLSLLKGPSIDSFAAATVTGLSTQRAERSLESLADANLVDAIASRRYRLHDLLYLFALERLEHEETKQAREQAFLNALRWYASSATRAANFLRPANKMPDIFDFHAPTFQDIASALQWLDEERLNLVAISRAGTSAVGSRKHRVSCAACVVVLGKALFPYFKQYGHLSDWLEIDKLAVQSARRIWDMKAALASALNELAVVYRKRGLLRESIDCFEESLQISRGLGDVRSEAVTLNNMGNTYRHLRDFDKAAICLEQSLAKSVRNGDPMQEALALGNLANVRRNQGRYDEATQLQERALNAHRSHGNRWEEAWSLLNLGAIYSDRRLFPQADELFEQALEMFANLGSDLGVAEALVALGQNHASGKRYDQAFECFMESMQRFLRTDDLVGFGRASRLMLDAFGKSFPDEDVSRLIARLLPVTGMIPPELASEFEQRLRELGYREYDGHKGDE
jgi:tetratricopeptide (TPR) repeat protein